MIVFFKAQARFTSNINRDFWRKVKKHKAPFLNLVAVGGCTNGYFSGSVDLPVEGQSRDDLAYEITAIIVSKVEFLSAVGVENMEFDEITVGIR